MIQNIFSEELIQAIGWTMIHSLWQGFAVAILMGIVMIGLQKKSSKVRHEFAFFSLFLIFILSLSTFIYLYDSAAEGATLGTMITVITEGGFVLENATIVQSFFQKSIEYFNEHLPLIVTLWLVGMVFFLLRLLGGLAFIQKLKTQQQQPLPSKWQTVFDEITSKFPMKKTVRIVESALAKTPMVVGYLKPVILFPLGAVNQLTQQEVEAVLAHELAHIYRNDYLLNIIQSFIEIIFYYHPAVWWISANIRTERENCCDDIAVKICGSSITYAKALVTLEEIQPAPNLAMSFSSGSKNQLLNRVKRILNQPQNKFNIMEKFTATCFLLAALFLFSFSPTKSEDHQANENSTNIEAAPLDFANTSETDTVPAPPPPPPPHHDKYRKKGNGKFVYQKDGESVEVKYKNDQIVKLKINGEEIAEANFTDYEEYIDELVEEVPLPPRPPHTSVSKTTTNGTTTTIHGNGMHMITKSEDENGNSVYIIKSDDSEAPVVIRGGAIDIDGETFSVGSAPVVIRDGQTISISDGDVVIDGHAMSISPDNFHFDFNDNDFVLAEIPDFPELSEMAVFPEMPDFPELAFGDFEDFHFDFDSIPSGSIHLDGERKKWDELSEDEKRELKEEMETLKAEMREQRVAMKEEMKEMHKLRKEEYKVQMEEAREKMEEARVQMREVQTEQRERMREMQQEQRELQESMREQQREQQREVREQQREVRGAASAERSKWTQTFEAQLQNKGQLESDGSYSFSMNENWLKINGEKQSQADLEKYQKLYESETGKSLGNNFSINISTDGRNNRSVSVSISDDSN
jgi:beta-lactamase regulating signal transducer with metallopeptidase domain